MQIVVSDTHAVVWHLTAPHRLGKAAARKFAASDKGTCLCYVPAISLVEISLLHQKGRLRFGVAKFIELLSSHPGYSILPLDIQQTLELERLVAIKDPMDRLIAAAAKALDCKLISCDDNLTGIVECIW